MAFETGNNLAPKKFSSEHQPPNRGRKAGSRNVTTVLKELLDKVAPGEVISDDFARQFCAGKKRVTNADAIAARLLWQAVVKGDPGAIREILDRTEGKATQPLSTDHGFEIIIRDESSRAPSAGENVS